MQFEGIRGEFSEKISGEISEKKNDGRICMEIQGTIFYRYSETFMEAFLKETLVNFLEKFTDKSLKQSIHDFHTENLEQFLKEHED